MLADDALLFGLEMEDEDIVMQHADEGAPGAAVAAGERLDAADETAALRAENETLKLQARPRVSSLPSRLRLTSAAHSFWS